MHIFAESARKKERKSLLWVLMVHIDETECLLLQFEACFVCVLHNPQLLLKWVGCWILESMGKGFSYD